MTTAPELPPAKAAKVAEFDAAPKPPEIAAIAPLLAKLRAVEELCAQAEDRIRASTPPVTAERLIAEGEAPQVSTGALRRALDAS